MIYSTEIIVSLITSIIGGVVVAVIHELFNRKKTSAEVEKILAEAEKFRVETAKTRKEIEKLNASLVINGAKVVDTLDRRGATVVSLKETSYAVHKEIP